jgi:flagellar protein FlaG
MNLVHAAAPGPLPSLPVSLRKEPVGAAGALTGAALVSPFQSASGNRSLGVDAAEADDQRLDSALQGLNETLVRQGRNLHFSVDRDTGITVVQIRDRKTNEMIRQIPSEEALRLARSLESTGAVLFTESA